jgi:hypothetical protein
MLPTGRLHAVLPLGTEDQVRLLEVTRLRNNSDSVQTASVGKLTSMETTSAAYDSSDGVQTASVGELISMEPTPATYDSNHIIQTASVGERTSMEPFPIFSGSSKSQARHINNSSSVISELPQSFYDHTYALESLQQCSYHDSNSVPMLGTQEHARSVTAGIRDITESLPNSPSVSHKVNSHQEQDNDTEFRRSSFDNVKRHLSFKHTKNVKSSDQKLCTIQNQSSSLALKHPANRKEHYLQDPNFQYSTDKLMVKHCSVGSTGTKDFSQSFGGQQVKQARLQSQGDQPSQSGARHQTDDIFNAKTDAYQLSNKGTKIGISAKHQESQADLPVLDVTSSETVTLQNTFRSTETCELPPGLPLDIIYEAVVSSNEVSRVQPGYLSDSQDPIFPQNEDTNEGVSSQELSSQCTQVSSQVPAKLKSDRPGTNKLICSESERTDLNRDSFTGIYNQASKPQQLFSVLDDSEASKSTEIDPESNFHVHVEIERAMHLRCYRQREGDEIATEPSTYVTFLHKQGSTSETELQMFTPLASHIASPSWCWHCDTWLSSDLLTNVSVP